MIDTRFIFLFFLFTFLYFVIILTILLFSKLVYTFNSSSNFFTDNYPLVDISHRSID